MAWIRKYWWVCLLVVVAVVFAVIQTVTLGKVDPPVEPIHNRIRDADTDAKIAKAAVKVKADEHREELEKIKAVQDGKERRARLVALLEKLDTRN